VGIQYGIILERKNREYRGKMNCGDLGEMVDMASTRKRGWGRFKREGVWAVPVY